MDVVEPLNLHDLWTCRTLDPCRNNWKASRFHRRFFFSGGIPSAPGGTFLDGSELVIGSCGNESSSRSNDGLILRFQEGRHNSESGIFWSITLLVPTSFHGAYPPENQHGTRK